MFGYNLAYGIPEGGYIGSFIPWSDSSCDTGYADGSDWYFQMVFCATTVSIVSGTMLKNQTMAVLLICSNIIRNFISNRNGLAVGEAG